MTVLNFETRNLSECRYFEIEVYETGNNEMIWSTYAGDAYSYAAICNKEIKGVVESIALGERRAILFV